MSLEQYEAILKSLKGFPKKINVFGGEPTMHPQFPEICRLSRKYFSKKKLILFTYGGKHFKKYHDLIYDTFGLVLINDHEYNAFYCLHQPSTVALGEAVPDEKLRDYLIENCWIDRDWCCAANIHGFYSCEVASALDYIFFGGSHAVPLSKKWYKKANFEHQRFLCQYCGMAIPMKRDPVNQKKEKFTPGLLEKFKQIGLTRTTQEWVEIFDHKFTLDEIRENAKIWYPGNFRTDKKSDDVCEEGRGIPNFEL
jgi:hypothetical protein